MVGREGERRGSCQQQELVDGQKPSFHTEIGPLLRAGSCRSVGS